MKEKLQAHVVDTYDLFLALTVDTITSDHVVQECNQLFGGGQKGGEYVCVCVCVCVWCVCLSPAPADHQPPPSLQGSWSADSQSSKRQ